MEIWITVIMLGSLGLTVAAMVAIPEMSRPTVPLGVNVPSDYANDPVVKGAVRRYRVWTLVGGTVAGIITLASSRVWQVSVLTLLGYVVWGMIAFALCRKPIMQAKQEQGWYDGVPVRLAASITPGQRAKPAWPLLVLSMGISLASLAVVAINYPSLPDPLPSHYDGAGNVTSWVPKSLGSALLLPLLACGSTLLLILVCIMFSRRGRTRFPDGDARAARHFQDARERTIQRTLAVATFLSALSLSIVAVAPAARLTPSGMAWAVWALVLASSLPIAWLVIDSIRQRRTFTDAADGSGPQSPDDDHLWKWGMFYVNRQDPRMWVEKRNGIGATVNVGHPGGLAFMGIVALMNLATIALVLTL